MDTWKILLSRQLKIIETKACKEFLNGIFIMKDMIRSCPNLQLLSEQINQITGWKITPVSGLLKSREYFQHLANKSFPVANSLRSWENLDYIESPDIWHDVFGHLPLLNNPIYSKFIETLSQKIYLTEGRERQMLDSLYWYTIEVGLCRENGNLKAYGAAILSSFTEIQYALSEQTKVHQFDWNKVTQAQVKIDEVQNNLFEIPSFDYLSELTKRIENNQINNCNLLTDFCFKSY